MKRAFAGLLLSSVLLPSLYAADAVTLAAQQEAMENFKRLSATLEELQTAQLSQQKQISALANDLSKVREDVARNNNNASVQESLRQLEKQILKVDESRVADNKRIQEALERLGQTIKDMPSVPAPRPPTRNGNNDLSSGSGGTSRGPSPRTTPEEGFEYIIQRDDRLDIIVKRYRDEKIMVTSKSIMDANPTVNWSRLRIGQKIFIPKPK
jgi:TolA-binding protein